MRLLKNYSFTGSDHFVENVVLSLTVKEILKID